jgi:prolyl oligopeptidase
VHTTATASSQLTARDDLWLEEVDSEKALTWVRSQNENTFKTLGDPSNSPLYPRLKAIYESKDKIPYVVKRGELYYNFWQDAQNPRGLWRRTTWDEYLKPTPKWEILLDIDKLGKDEGQSWVWQGSIPLDAGPGVGAKRCLVQLSPGGSDAVEMREFDLVNRYVVIALRIFLPCLNPLRTS